MTALTDQELDYMSKIETPTINMSSDDELRKAFLFEFDGVLIDPITTEGTVSHVLSDGEIEYHGAAVDVKTIVVDDPYMLADPESYKVVNSYVKRVEQYVVDAGFNPLDERQKRHPYVIDVNDKADKRLNRRSNAFQRAWLHDETVESLIAWQGLIPSARALGYLANPLRSNTIVDKDGKEHTTTIEADAQLRYVDDAIAIRIRGVAMGYLALEHLDCAEDKTQPLGWLDVGSGTAEFTIKALKTAEDNLGISTELVALDMDADALTFVGENAQQIGYEGQITTKTQNVMSGEYVVDLKANGHKKGLHIVGNSGLKEYMPERDLNDGLGGDELGRFRNISLLPNASEFTRHAWEMVTEGGALISGNMELNRPQVDWVFGVVNWPVINARPIESLLRIYKRAGVLDDPRSEVTVYRVEDSVSGAVIYNLVKAIKRK